MYTFPTCGQLTPLYTFFVAFITATNLELHSNRSCVLLLRLSYENVFIKLIILMKVKYNIKSECCMSNNDGASRPS